MRRGTIMFYAAMFAAYAVAANPVVTGIAIHEYAGLGVLFVFFAHVALYIDRVVAYMKSARSASRANTGIMLLDAALVFVLMACVVSGVMVSGTVLPTLGLYATGFYFWDPLHAVSAKLLLALLLVHVALRGPVLVRMAKALVSKRREGEGHGSDG